MAATSALRGSTIASGGSASPGGLPISQAGNAAQSGVIVTPGLSSPTPFYTTQGDRRHPRLYPLRFRTALFCRHGSTGSASYYADMNHNQEIQSIIQMVMDDTYNYLYQQTLLRSNQANLENAQMSLDAANERFALD